MNWRIKATKARLAVCDVCGESLKPDSSPKRWKHRAHHHYDHKVVPRITQDSEEHLIIEPGSDR